MVIIIIIIIIIITIMFLHLAIIIIIIIININHAGLCEHLLCFLHLPCEGFVHSHCQVAFLLLLSQHLDLWSHPRFKGLILRKLLYFLGEALRRGR